MKKFIVLALLSIPMASFAASSVRVLGSKSATPGTAASAKVVPAKVNAGKTAATSRIGTTVRAKPATVAAPTTITTTNKTAGTAGSRFPVITPASSYKSVSAPQSSGNTYNNTENNNTNVNMNNYYTKNQVDNKITEINQDIQEIQNTINNIEPQEVDLEDPRFDAIRTEDPTNKWSGKTLPQGYVYMWIEESANN